jgi:hypothetical protein
MKIHNLSKYDCQTRRATFRSVYQWLVCGFHINLDNTLLTVHVVVKQDNLWDLITISNTNEWKTYITEDLERGRLFSILV